MIYEWCGCTYTRMSINITIEPEKRRKPKNKGNNEGMKGIKQKEHDATSRKNPGRFSNTMGNNGKEKGERKRKEEKGEEAQHSKSSSHIVVVRTYCTNSLL